MAADESIPAHGGGIPAADVVSNNWFVRSVESLGIGAVNRLPLRMRPYVLRATRRARPSRRVSAGIAVTQETVGGVPITWLGRERGDGMILYLHGGAYLAGPISVQWRWLATIHRQTGLAAGMLLYRRPPQDPHPAAWRSNVVADQCFARRPPTGAAQRRDR
jgi:acetyl esterase/lipase